MICVSSLILCDGVYHLETLMLDKINLKNRKSLMFSVIKQTFIYTMLDLFETSNYPNLYYFEKTHTKQCYTISRISLNQPRFQWLESVEACRVFPWLNKNFITRIDQYEFDDVGKWPLFDLDIHNHRQEDYSCWWFNNGNININQTFKAWLFNVKPAFRYLNSPPPPCVHHHVYRVD